MAFQRCSGITQSRGLEITVCNFFNEKRSSSPTAPLTVNGAHQQGDSVHQMGMVSMGAGPPVILLCPFLLSEPLGPLQHGPEGSTVLGCRSCGAE